MFVGAITEYIDVAQLALYGFWLFFALLVLYLHRESKREGYPLDTDRSDRITVEGFPKVPAPKTYLLRDGTEVRVPDPARRDAREVAAVPLAGFPGAPLVPTGDPLADGVGPAAWAERADVPEPDNHGGDRIRPMSAIEAEGFRIAGYGTDPRGAPVRTFDGEVVGTVDELWIDHMESMVRYLGVATESGARVVMPMNMAVLKKAKAGPADGSLFDRMKARRGHEVRVASVTAEQFARAPTTAAPDRITMREEDRIQGYFGGGAVYATAKRAEPLL